VLKEALDSEKVFQLERECRILRHLHAPPFAVQAFRRETDRSAYAVLSPAGLGSLKGVCFDAGVALRCVQQVLGQLRQAHIQGILHRDVRPSNIIDCCTDDRRDYRLADWGLAESTNNISAYTQPFEPAPVGVETYFSFSLLWQRNRNKNRRTVGVTYSFLDDLEALAYTLTAVMPNGNRLLKRLLGNDRLAYYSAGGEEDKLFLREVLRVRGWQLNGALLQPPEVEQQGQQLEAAHNHLAVFVAGRILTHYP
jgi:serine/threonine protein kinase